MEKLSQTSKELLAIAMLKEFGCFDEAKKLAKDEQGRPLDITGMPLKSVKYLTNRLEHALSTINEKE